MSNTIYLHRHKDFKGLLEIISQERSINPQLIEKDYWLMHCLYGLQDSGLKFELKGGTSLSKGYKIIKRFSEDIDIKVIPPPDQDVKSGKNQNSKFQIESRKIFFDWLINQIKIDGIVSIERDPDYYGKDIRNAGIRLKYEGHYSGIPKLKEGILLEVGFDFTAPNENHIISSWAYDYAVEKNVPVIDNRAKDVPCYHPGYTLVEKLQAVSTKFRQQQEKGDFPINFMRHYYDIYHLLEQPSVLFFIGTEDYNKWKDVRFGKNDNKNLRENEAFHLTNPDVRKVYQDAYEKSYNLYYDGQDPFENILKSINDNIDKL